MSLKSNSNTNLLPHYYRNWKLNKITNGDPVQQRKKILQWKTGNTYLKSLQAGINNSKEALKAKWDVETF